MGEPPPGLTATGRGSSHRFVLRGIHELDRASFVAEVTRLVVGYARARPAPRRRSG